mmetsp:Transcript_29593/g.62767  ORF Transcript_29593/g.62767 Transcript_29593/m.62767 type:complete len:89 (+) Transcript_29593:788-1054(+)
MSVFSCFNAGFCFCGAFRILGRTACHYKITKIVHHFKASIDLSTPIDCITIGTIGQLQDIFHLFSQPSLAPTVPKPRQKILGEMSCVG